MTELGSLVGGELGNDRLSKFFAQLDTPLIEGIDPPDCTLDKGLVLVEGDQLAEDLGRKLGDED